MKRLTGLLAALLALCSGFAALAAAPPPPPPPPLNVYEFVDQSFREASRKLDQPEACAECKRLTGVFYIDWERHTGFHIYPTSFDGEVHRATAGERLNPILGREMGEAFRAALMTSVESSRPGFCECSGWAVEHNGMTFFRIDEAKLHPVTYEDSLLRSPP